MSKFYDYEGNIIADVTFVTPEMFGAKGDGVTDDGPAFKEMLKNGNVVCYLQPKTYKIATENNVYNNTFIIGNGATLDVTNNCNAFLICERGNWAYGYEGSNNVVISDMTINMNGMAKNHAIIVHAQNITFRRCVFLNIDGAHSMEVNASRNVLFDNCEFKNLSYGSDRKEAINIDPATEGTSVNYGYYDNTNSDYITIKNCLFEHCFAPFGNHELTDYRGNEVRFIGCTVRNCTRGANCHSYKNLYIQDSVFDGIDLDCIRLKGTQNVHVCNNVITSTGKAISIEGTDANVILSQNIISSEDTTPIAVADTASNVETLNNMVLD